MTGSLASTSGSAASRGRVEEAVAVSRPDLRGVVEHAAVGAVEVRVSRRQQARASRRRRRPCRASRASNWTGIGVSVIAMKRSPSLVEVDVRVVGDLRVEERDDATEERAAGIRRELRVLDLARLLGGAVGLGLEEAVGVGDLPAGDREAVEHREAVEPVVHPLLADLPLRGPGPDQGAREPVGKLALRGSDSTATSLSSERSPPASARVSADAVRRSCSSAAIALSS